MADPAQPLVVPPFESKLPQEMLEGLDIRGRYLYSKLDEIGQTQTWLINQTVRQNGKLDSIEAQVIRTNGRVGKVETKVEHLEVDSVGVKDTVETVALVKRLAMNKWVWIAFVAFLVFGIPFLAVHAPGAQAFYLWLVGGGLPE